MLRAAAVSLWQERDRRFFALFCFFLLLFGAKKCIMKGIVLRWRTHVMRAAPKTRIPQEGMVKTMRLGTSTNLYAYERGSDRELPFAEQVRACAAAGFTVLDLDLFESAHNHMMPDDLNCPEWEAKIDELGELAAQLGVSFSQAHAPFCSSLFLAGKQPDADYVAQFHELMRRAVLAAGKLGIRWVTVHPMTDTVNAEYDLDVNRRTNLDFYAPYVELADKAGTGIAVENMANFNPAVRRNYCASPEELIDLVDSFAAPNVGICWDFGHARMMMSNQPRQLRKLGARLKATHVQDNTGDRDSHLIPMVGGNVRWEEIMPVLREIGYTGDFMLEAHSYMRQVPRELWVPAGKLAYDFGMYLMNL